MERSGIQGLHPTLSRPSVHEIRAAPDCAALHPGYAYYPHYAHALATTDDWDIVSRGHDHFAAVTRVANIKGGESLVVNPGTVGGVTAPARYIFADLEGMTFEILGVEIETRAAG